MSSDAVGLFFGIVDLFWKVLLILAVVVEMFMTFVSVLEVLSSVGVGAGKDLGLEFSCNISSSFLIFAR